ncbi:MAG: ribonuclease III [Trichlorobacter sp.]
MPTLPATILGYTFLDTSLLRQALTHPSFVNESRESGLTDYQRLEFLGDAVLGLCLADLLSQRQPELAEGDLSRLRSTLVDQPRLAELAARLDIAPHILLGRGEEQDGGREKPSILADVLEALIGAIYRDAGFIAIRSLIEQLYLPLLTPAVAGVALNDPKSELQEWLAAHHRPLPTYDLTGEVGPPHDRRFTVSISLDGQVIGAGEGRSKKVAQQTAAKAALELLQQS